MINIIMKNIQLLFPRIDEYLLVSANKNIWARTTAINVDTITIYFLGLLLWIK